MTHWLRSLLLSLVIWPAGFSAAAPQAVPAPEPVIRPGEELVFRVRSERFGDIGTALMRVVEDTVAGRRAYRLMFDFNARVLLFSISDRTRSWLDPETLSTLRYLKEERSPIGRREEAVEVNTADSSWLDHGVRRQLASQSPLDELAFIYLVRSVDPFTAPIQLERHFDPARNPVKLCVLGRETIEALGQNLEATVLQMEVPDARQKHGRNRLRFYIGDSPERLLLRIETSMPVAGALTLTLIAVNVPGVRP